MNYNEHALIYAEQYGILNHTVKGNVMLYQETFPLEKAIYKVEVNLDTMKEQRKCFKMAK